jgi:UDP-glucose 4-epimerase
MANRKSEASVRILVTGGAGFIGSNVVDGYIQAGHDVVVVDNLFTGKRSNVNPRAKFYGIDIRSEEVESIISREKPEVINHHAAQISVPASVEDPLLDADINIKGFLNLVEKAVKQGVKKVIFISSGGAIYGECLEFPTPEACPPKPLSPYAITKFSSECYLVYYKHQYGLEYSVLRYSNVYGPRQIPHGEAGVVAIFMNHLLENKPSVLNHFPEEPDGMARDYCYVGDVVRANLRALSRGDGQSINIGSGRATKTGDLYRIIYEEVRKIRPDISSALAVPERRHARLGDLKRSCLVVGKAREVLGWTPEIGLTEGIRLTLEWWGGKEKESS